MGVGSTWGQDPIQREVNVTRAYEPSVQHSLKLNIMPDMTDTTQMRPDHQYEITPRPLNYGFAVNPLNPARIATVAETAPLPFYAKLGAGYALQSVADIRYAKPIGDRTHFGAYASHYGRYGKIKNDMQIKESATGTNNRAGAFLDFRADDDFLISTELSYDFRNVTRYGYYSSSGSLPSWFDTSKENLKQHYHNPRFDFFAGNSFTDHNKFNFGLSGGVNYFADRYNYNQFGWEFDASFGFRAGTDGFFIVGAQAFGNSGMKNIRDFSNIAGYPKATYYFDNGDFRFTLGVKIGYTETKMGDEKDDRSLFLPALTLEKALAGGRFTPFADISSDVTDNSYGAMAKRNPYLFSGIYAPNTVGYNGRIGVKGTLGTFKYKVYGGYDLFKDYVYWVNAQEYSAYGNAFSVLTDDLNAFRAGVEVRANILNALTLEGNFVYSDYSPDNYDFAGGEPEIRAAFGIGYNHRNRLYLKLGAEVTGERTLFEYDGVLKTHVLPGQTDLRFEVEYFINKQFGLFLNLNNLLDHKIYEFNRYRELGINGMAGIKISF